MTAKDTEIRGAVSGGNTGAPVITKDRGATTPSDGGGLAPGGMWWVAWRQQRVTVLVSVAVLAVLVLGFLWVRAEYLAGMAAHGCRDVRRPPAI